MEAENRKCVWCHCEFVVPTGTKYIATDSSQDLLIINNAAHLFAKGRKLAALTVDCGTLDPEPEDVEAA